MCAPDDADCAVVVEVRIDSASVSRVWRQSGRDEFWIELRPSSPIGSDSAAVDRFDAAVNELNAVFEERMAPEAMAAAPTPRGFVLLTHGVDTEELLEEWLGALAERLEQQGLSSSLCKRSGSWCSDVGVDAVGVDDRELLEGLLPVRGDLAFDEAAGCSALGRG